jgi:hypothetical protein
MTECRPAPEKGDSMTDKRPYGAVQQPVLAWLARQAPGTEFYYGDTAEELGLEKPSVSAVLRSVIRSANPQLVPGLYSGWYRVTGTGTAPRTEPNLPENRDAGNPIMEVIGKLQSGNLILRDEDKNIWEAQRM